MVSIEHELYVGMLDKLVSANLITQFAADKLAGMLEKERKSAMIKRRITDLLQLITLLETQ